ncbi:hypothetical protein BDV96DRAFT_638611 [Lophiotrema nucula]|uniref:Uncharacterized protein n=1 Tax=Lophiotrema nucula TaxID=690887 RepID=A0A6A5YFW3_9PLEO|nr:hypothetical protein BDV96DRAFT_638611 [Lophiotrema nucula]
MDWVGCLLFLLGSVPLVFALLEAEVLKPWKSASTIAFRLTYTGRVSGLGSRTMLINSSSPINTALRNLPMIAIVPFVIIALAKTKFSTFFVLVACTVAQIISVSVLATVPESFPAGFYVVLAIIGCGNGTVSWCWILDDGKICSYEYEG